MADLKKLGDVLSFKKRRETGQAVFLSRLFYGVEVWGPGITITQLKSLQACMNRLVRWITKNPLGTSARRDLIQCGLLSVNQTIVYKVLVQGLLVLKYDKPDGLKLLLEPPKHGINTRGSKGVAAVIDSYYSNKSWRNKFVKYFNMLPNDLRTADMKIGRDKKELKQWVSENVILI